jgi:predicted RNase H-like HicB family nuclease
LRLAPFANVIKKTKNDYADYGLDLPGCVATRKTLEETEQQIREAIEFNIRGLHEDGSPIPEPKSYVGYVVAAWLNREDRQTQKVM